MTIEFAGENPCVVLYDHDGNAVSAVSYWNANFSVAGSGQALFLLRRQDGRIRGRLFAEAKAPAAGADITRALATATAKCPRHFRGPLGRTPSATTMRRRQYQCASVHSEPGSILWSIGHKVREC